MNEQNPLWELQPLNADFTPWHDLKPVTATCVRGHNPGEIRVFASMEIRPEWAGSPPVYAATYCAGKLMTCKPCGERGDLSIIQALTMDQTIVMVGGK